jgi:archaellum component FlaC
MSATFVSRFGGKTAGQLIRADEWNDLVAAIDALATGLTTELNSLETETDTRLDADEAQLAAAKGQLETLSTTVAGLQGEVTALTQLLGQYFRVNLSTSRVSYVAGEQATIVAQIRDLRDQPVTFTDAQRPWIDFVTVWGHLAAAPGFQSIGGDGAGGDRALSVRVSSSGQAQALVRAEVGADLSPDVHAEMAAALTTKLSPKSVAETILESTTPQEAKSSGAFAAIASMYDKKSGSGVRTYADKYYVDKAASIVGKVAPPIVGHSWRDYRSTVLAFVRADSDPTTPDQGRGVSTIQLTFRDWIGPWIVIHYLDDLEIAKAVPTVRSKLAPKFTNDYFDSVTRVKAEIDGIVGRNGRGLIGRIKDFEVVHNALDGISVSQPAALVDKVTKTVQQAVAFQQALEPAQATTFGGGDQVALDAVTETTVAANGDVTAVKGQVAAIQSKVDQVGGKVEDQGKTITALDTKVTQTSSHVQTIDNRVVDVNTKVSKVQTLYPDEVRNQFLDIKEAVLDVKSIKAHLNLP